MILAIYTTQIYSVPHHMLALLHATTKEYISTHFDLTDSGDMNNTENNPSLIPVNKKIHIYIYIYADPENFPLGL